MLKINSLCVLTNLLSAGIGEISVRLLKDFRRLLREENPAIYVDISSDSISSTVEDTPRMFDWKGDNIIRAKQSEEDNLFDPNFVEDQINYQLLPDVKKILKKVSQKMVA